MNKKSVLLSSLPIIIGDIKETLSKLQYNSVIYAIPCTKKSYILWALTAL